MSRQRFDTSEAQKLGSDINRFAQDIIGQVGTFLNGVKGNVASWWEGYDQRQFEIKIEETKKQIAKVFDEFQGYYQLLISTITRIKEESERASANAIR